MQGVQTIASNSVLRINVARAALGKSHGGFYTEVAQGLLPKPFKIGNRASAVLATEVAAINAARAAGQSDDAIRALVIRLHEARIKAAPTDNQPADSSHPIMARPLEALQAASVGGQS